MQTQFGEITYCTNIHAGESWSDHFAALQENIPGIKKRIADNKPFGLGLRLSHQASVDLQSKKVFDHFKAWLKAEDLYVFTMNGFPYGGFHNTIVKDQVHAPDWTTEQRVSYTIGLFNLLVKLLPENKTGGISTSPLSYKHWHVGKGVDSVFVNTTYNVLKVVVHLIHISETAGKILHLDIEPEPDGLLESGPEYITWYEKFLLPLGTQYLAEKLGYTPQQAFDAITQHVQLCYDICHFAVGYENHQQIISILQEKKMKVGKIQISAALKALLPIEKENRNVVINAFQQFNETTYLHQVVARHHNNSFTRYPDLPEALLDSEDVTVSEWRSHFHVPLFVEDYGVLQSTQEDIQQVLSIQKAKLFTGHLEVETYTWEVLPDPLKLPLSDSIVRELRWVLDELNKPRA